MLSAMHRAARSGEWLGGQLRSFTSAEHSAHGTCLVPEPLTVGVLPSLTLVTLPAPRLSCLVVTRVTVKAWVRATAPRVLFGSAILAPRGETEAQGDGTQPQGRLLCGLPGLGSCPAGCSELRPPQIAGWSSCPLSPLLMSLTPWFSLQSFEEYFRTAQCGHRAQTLSVCSACPGSECPTGFGFRQRGVSLLSLGPMSTLGKEVISSLV